MAIQKMSLVSIVGPCSKFDYTVDKYVVNNNIQIEDALYMLEGVDGVRSYVEPNPYSNVYRRSQEVCSLLGVAPRYVDGSYHENILDAISELDSMEDQYNNLKTKLNALDKELNENTVLIEQLKRLGDIDVPLEEMFNFEFMRFRFGRFTKEGFNKLTNFLADTDAFFLKGATEGNYIYGIYITPHALAKTVDSIFASLNFERIMISAKATGTPLDAIRKLEDENKQLKSRMADAKAELEAYVNLKRDRLLAIYSVAKRKFQVFNVRQLAVRTESSFYIAGWMPEEEAQKLSKTLEDELEVIYLQEKPEEVQNVTPPTVLKNPGLFRPFESMVSLYGMPAYNELDPTIAFGITYMFMFGMMFGDLGQGIVLAVLGFMAYKLWRLDLGAALSLAGLSSMVFGFLYGSVFGSEEIIKNPLWIRPMGSSDNISTVLFTAVGIGVLIIAVAICLNLYNAIITKDFGKLLFSHNGLAGLVFYIGGLLLAYMSLKGGGGSVAKVAAFLLIIPLALIFMQEPLSKLIAKHKDWMPGNKGEFFVQSFFELFDILLSFVTNTISFIRVGAFALIHVGMMMVVYIFAEMAHGAGGIIVIIFGNIFVMALEGLVVSIQVLRLEFYEIFSRFFRGDGRVFSPLYIK